MEEKKGGTDAGRKEEKRTIQKKEGTFEGMKKRWKGQRRGGRRKMEENEKKIYQF